MSFLIAQLSTTSLAWISVLWLVILLALRGYTKSIKERKIPFLDGPKPWPIIGNLLFFSKLFNDPDIELMKLAKSFGGTCMLWMASSPVMIISKAEDAKILLDKVCPRSNQGFYCEAR
jgi:hypothetical protein